MSASGDMMMTNETDGDDVMNMIMMGNKTIVIADETENATIATLKEYNVPLGLGLSIGLYILLCVLVPLLFYIIFMLLKHDPCGFYYSTNDQYTVNGHREGDSKSWKKKSAITTVSLELGNRGADHPPLYPMKEDAVLPSKHMPIISEQQEQATSIASPPPPTPPHPTPATTTAEPEQKSNGDSAAAVPPPPSDSSIAVEIIVDQPVEQFHV